MSFRVVGVALLGLASGCVAVDAGNKSVFAQLTYGKDDRVTPSSKPDFQLYAALQFEVMGPWQQPGPAAQCLASLDAADLERIGRATSGARDPNTWANKLWTELATLRVRPACVAGFAADPAQLAWAVGKASGVVFDFAELTWLDPARKAETYVAGASALQRVASVVGNTPSGQAAQNDLPALALAGGAANGAFTAGILYELLSAREEALLRVPAADRPALDRASRFSAVVGTSVGALLAQLLEFAMIDDTNLEPDQLAFIAQCNAYQFETEVKHGELSGGKTGCFSKWPASPFPEVAPIPGRPLQSCALKLLAHSFADVDESDLLCSEPGSVLRAVDALGRPRVNLIRFDPMQTMSLDELLRLFSGRMDQNAMSRVVVSVETQQNQQLGLDERACPAADRQLCLTSGVMASVVLPAFARPVSQTWSGFAPTGECGMWFDGGLRSLLPSQRALSLTRAAPLLANPVALRVLAIDTGRLTPIPYPRPRTLIDVALTALEQYSSEQDDAELRATQHEAELRDSEFDALQALLNPPSGARLASHPRAEDPRVHGLYVPSDVPDWVVAGAGYSFDRYVMRGLFLWGRQVARVQLGAAVDLTNRLGWPAPVPEQIKAVIAERVANDAAFTEWLADYSQPVCPAFTTWRLGEGARRINTEMATCVEAADGPKYFTCPAGVWDAGGVK
jgi:predicted acylesterase/phospholipase RssA